MSKIQKFEDLLAWQKARQLAGYVYELTRKEKFARDFGLRDQIQRAVGSVMHNVAEGFDSGTDPEFARFLKMARRSAAKFNLNFILHLTPSTSPQMNSNKRTISQLNQKS